jgi:hypothetical protein
MGMHWHTCTAPLTTCTAAHVRVCTATSVQVKVWGRGVGTPRGRHQAQDPWPRLAHIVSKLRRFLGQVGPYLLLRQPHLQPQVPERPVPVIPVECPDQVPDARLAPEASCPPLTASLPAGETTKGRPSEGTAAF